jgi:nitrous oxidase accessory protein NosD
VTKKTFTLPIAIISLLLVFGLATDCTSANFVVLDAPYITIQADGSVEPQTDQISRSENTYTLNANLTKTAVKILCNNIIFNGAGHNIVGGSGETYADVSGNEGLRLQNVNNVTVKDVTVLHFTKGIYMEGCVNCSIIRVSAGRFYLLDSQQNLITQSQLNFGICTMRYANDNLIYNNNVGCGAHSNSNNLWDNGSVGNYWGSDYNGTDADGDGIGDTPFILPNGWEPYDIDNYPLMNPFTIQETPSPSQGQQLHLELSLTLFAEVSAALLAVLGATAGLLFYRKKHRRSGKTC